MIFYKNFKLLRLILAFALAFTWILSSKHIAIAADAYIVEIKLENHVFTPSEVRVPAGRKIKLVVHNMDPTIEEFESISLKREKILRSKSKTNIILAPLRPGRYDFMGEFHEETAKGVLIAE